MFSYYNRRKIYTKTSTSFNLPSSRASRCMLLTYTLSISVFIHYRNCSKLFSTDLHNPPDENIRIRWFHCLSRDFIRGEIFLYVLFIHKSFSAELYSCNIHIGGIRTLSIMDFTIGTSSCPNSPSKGLPFAYKVLYTCHISTA